MSESTTAARRSGSLLIRGAEPADHEAIGGVVLGAYERLAAEAGAPVLAIRTASIMTEAIAGYERLGYRRSPEFDGTEPVNSVAHLRYVAQMYMNLAR